MKQQGKFEMLGFKLVLTCSCVPEQYDVFNQEGEQVAYLRLRSTHFDCHIPDASGEIIYSSSPDGYGIFEEYERERYLTEALQAVAEIEKELM